MSNSLQLGRCFTAVLSSSSSSSPSPSPSPSPSSSYQCRVAPLRIACYSRSVSVLEALPSQIVPPLPLPLPSTPMPPPSPPPPTAMSDEDEPVGNAAQDLSGGSGIRVPRQRHISVSKSELLDAITAAMFPSREEARQFLSLSQCLDLILHAEHKSILEEMRADFDLALSGKTNTFSPGNSQSVGRKVVVNQESDTFKNSSLESSNINDKEQNNGDEVSTSSDFTQDLKQFLDFSLEMSNRSFIKSSRVPIPSRFQRAFMKLLYNAEFEELSPRDLKLASTLNTDYLLTVPIYVDWKKASESSTIIFRRGYATEREKGLLIGQKLDYLQSKLLQSFFFPLIGKPLGKLFVWLNEVFESIKKQNPGILENKVTHWLKDLFLSLKPQSYDEQIADNLKRYDILSKEFPIWVAAQKAVTQYERILKVAGPREKLFKKFLAWIGLVPSTPEQAIDFDLDSAGSEFNLSSSFLSRISLSDIWKPASPKSCGNDFKKMLRTAFSILVSPSILQEPAFQELILLYTEKVGEIEIADQDGLASLQMKIYERIPIPDLPVVFPHKKLSFRILDTVRLDAATILGLLAYFFSYKFENIASSPSAIILDVIAATALVIYVFRVVLGYKLTRDRYQLLVNRTLYEKTVASGFGSIHFLLDASEQQLYKEAILAYATLLKSDNSQERSMRAIGEKCEEFMHNTFQEQIEMPIEKAVETLVWLGLVVPVMNSGVVAVDLQQEQQAVPCSTATLILRSRWNALIN